MKYTEENALTQHASINSDFPFRSQNTLVERKNIFK